jgi:hypothetical protein
MFHVGPYALLLKTYDEWNDKFTPEKGIFSGVVFEITAT